MCQTLFYIPPTLFGLPLFGAGLLSGLVLVLTLGGILLRLIRKGWDEECWSYLWLGVLAMAIVGIIAPKVATPEGFFPIRGYGVCLLLAVLLGLGLLYWRARSNPVLSGDQLLSLAIWSVVCGILGARVFYVVQYWNQMVVPGKDGGVALLKTLINLVNLAEGGLVVYGGVIAGTITVITFLRYHKLPILKSLDLIVPALVLGMAVGRIGCFLNGCCYGAVCPPETCCAVTFKPGTPPHVHQIEEGLAPYYGMTFRDEGPGRVVVDSVEPGSSAAKAHLRPGMPVSLIGFPEEKQGEKTLSVFAITDAAQAGRVLVSSSREVAGHGVVFLSETPDSSGAQYLLPPDETPPRVLPVYPTQLFSAGGNLLLCGLLLLFSRFVRRPGLVFVAFLFLEPVLRFCVEFFRDDVPPFPSTGLTISQHISIGLFLAGILLLVYIFRNVPPEERATE